MSSSSTRCSCTGATSGWIRNTSRSRQLACSWTSRQSLAKRCSTDGSSGTCRLAQISAASSGCALPLNTAISFICPSDGESWRLYSGFCALGGADAGDAVAGDADHGVVAEDHVDVAAVGGQRQAQPQEGPVRRAAPGEAVIAGAGLGRLHDLVELAAPVVGGGGAVDVA